MTLRTAPVRGSRRNVRLALGGAISLIEADPDLAHDLPDLRRAPARPRIRAELGLLQRGVWRIDEDRALDRARLGLLVIDGVLTRRVKVGRRRSAELLGTGDMLSPRVGRDDPGATLPLQASLRVLLPVRVALLGDDTLAGLARLPAVFVELNRRTLWRSRALAIQLALASEPHLDTRLQLLLWHLADRWGRREDCAVVLPIPLTCDLLAELAGAERSAVSRAISRLARTGLLARREDGALVLLNGTGPVTGDCSSKVKHVAAATPRGR